MYWYFYSGFSILVSGDNMDYDRVREIALGILMAIVFCAVVYGVYKVVNEILTAAGYYSSW